MYTDNHIIDPFYDEGFKLIFGRENVSERLLIDLLNNIFSGDPYFGNITSLTFINTERPNELIAGKGVRYDVRCRTAVGHQYIVEMQKAHQKHFIERCEYYVSRSIADQGYKGTDEDNEIWDFSMMPVVGVFFCNFKINELDSKPLTTASVCDDETGKPIGCYQRYAFIQLPCFNKEQVDCASMLDRWFYNIKNMGNMQTVAFTTDNDIFKYLKSVSNVAALSRPDREFYEACLMRARDYNATLKSAAETAMEEGRAEGRAEGEKIAKVNMARKLLSMGMDFSGIAELTDLTLEEIKAIKI